MTIKKIFGALLGTIASLSLVSADLIAPSPSQIVTGVAAQYPLITAGVAIAVVGLISWLIIKIKKKNALKSNK